MDVGWSGVIFVWVGFLWPIIVTSLFALFKSSPLRKGSYFVLSIASGYVSIFAGNFLTLGCVKILTSSYLLGKSGESFKKYFSSSIDVLFIIFMVLPPIGVAFYIFRKRLTKFS